MCIYSIISRRSFVQIEDRFHGEEMVKVFYIQKFIDDYNKDKFYNEKNLTEVISGYISNAFSAIDDDLAQLQSDVDSGRCSNQDIYEQIQEIRDRL